MRKVAVVGAAGQLGRDLVTRLPGEVRAWTRADLDLEKPDTIQTKLDAERPDVIVNCAAYNLVDLAEADPRRRSRSMPGAYEHWPACEQHRVKLVHISTDYVFGLDATRAEPWRETDAPGPVSNYGLSKLAGEYLVRATLENHLIIRTCGLYGVHGVGGKGGNFVETMLRLAGQGKPLRVVNDQRCTPTYTADLAQVIVKLIESDVRGLIQVTNQGDMTWHDFAAEIFRQAKISADLTPISSKEYNAPARRPAYSVLSLAKLSTVGVPLPRPWPEALAAYLHERQKFRS